MINCPYCGNPESTVKEVKSRPDFFRRYRVCSKCHKSYTTHETLAVYAGKSAGMITNLAPTLEADD